MAPQAHDHSLALPYALHPRMIGHQLVFAAFLLTQILDGVLTYSGVIAFGIAAEGNPLLAWLMSSYGEVLALASAKIVAAACGVGLYLLAVDRLLAALTLAYLGVAVIPWTLVLL